MNFDRFSVSLKVDTDDNDFYKCVLDLKESKELSSTLVTLLHLFYEDEEIRARVENYENNSDEFMKAVREQFNKVQMFHQQSVIQTEMAKSHIEGIGEIADSVGQQATGEQAQAETSTGLGDDKKVLLLEREIETVKQSVDGMTNKFDQLLQIITKNTGVIAPQPQVEPVEEPKATQEPVKRSPLIKEDITEDEPQQKTQVVNNLIKADTEPVSKVEEVVVEPVQPVQTFEIPVAPIGFGFGVEGGGHAIIDDDEEEEKEAGANVTFNKLLGSIKKRG